MKLDPEVALENRKMARDCLILTALMGAGFLIARRFDLSVFFGLLIGYALAVGNFYFMSVGLTQALSTGDETAAKLKIRQSYLIRTLVMLAVMAFSLWTERIHWVPVVASVFYPRIILAARGAWTWILRRRHPEAPEPAAEVRSLPDAAGEEAPDKAPDEIRDEARKEDGQEEPDEFEKFVKHFAKGPVPGEEKKDALPAEKPEDPGDSSGQS